MFSFRVYQGFYLGDIPIGPGRFLRYSEVREFLAEAPLCSPPGFFIDPAGFSLIGTKGSPLMVLNWCLIGSKEEFIAPFFSSQEPGGGICPTGTPPKAIPGTSSHPAPCGSTRTLYHGHSSECRPPGPLRTNLLRAPVACCWCRLRILRRLYPALTAIMAA